MTTYKGIIKRQASRIIALAMCFAFFASADDFIKISSWEQFDSIGRGHTKYPLSGNYELMNDISAPANIKSADGGRGFRPIGTKAAPFTGEFYGANHTISGLYINRPNMGDVGLFGYVGKGGVIRNLGVLADSVAGSFAVGILAGTNEGQIRGSYTSGRVSADRRTDSHTGGLVGVNIGNINKSYSAASVRGEINVGGLVGFLFGGSIFESYATGAVRGANFAAGLVGYIFGGDIERSFSAGPVTGTARGNAVGGLVGDDFNTSNKSWSTKGKGSSGDFVKKADIVNSFWDMETSGQRTSSPVGGTGKSTEQMLDKNTFINAGWKFDDTTWTIDESASGSFYPQLSVTPMCTLIYIAGANGAIHVSGVEEPMDSSVMRVGVGVHGLEVTAVPHAGYEFYRWDDSVMDSVRQDTAKTSGSFSFTALFIKKDEPPPSVVWYTSTKGGSLKIDGSNEEIDSYNNRDVKKGTSLTVTAIPSTGWHFVRWSDNNSTNATRTDIVTTNLIKAKAIFAQ
ncbi:MAG: hypothetical protein FWE57_04725 [Chitinispirillia bacterium]|nr:hypothetical protein [Chitinispirillia bacterium]